MVGDVGDFKSENARKRERREESEGVVFKMGFDEKRRFEKVVW